MTEVTLLPFDLAAVQRKKLTVDFEGGSQSSDGGLLLLREAERSLGICARFATTMSRLENMPNRREAVQMTAALIDQFCTSGAAGRDHARHRATSCPERTVFSQIAAGFVSDAQITRPGGLVGGD
jgi:hypothetical protein